MTDPAAKARELMAAIRYQVFRPEVTTMGPCPRCGESSRGASFCADCVAVELDGLPDAKVWPEGALGRMYMHACKMQRSAERAILEALGGGET